MCHLTAFLPQESCRACIALLGFASLLCNTQISRRKDRGNFSHRLVQDGIKMVLYSFRCSEVGSSNLWEERNRRNHRGGGPETPSVTGRRPVLLLPALCWERKKKGSGRRDCIIRVQICILLESDLLLRTGLNYNGSWLDPVQVLKCSNPFLPQRDIDSPSPHAQGLFPHYSSQQHRGPQTAQCPWHTFPINFCIRSASKLWASETLLKLWG